MLPPPVAIHQPHSIEWQFDKRNRNNNHILALCNNLLAGKSQEKSKKAIFGFFIVRLLRKLPIYKSFLSESLFIQVRELPLSMNR